MPRSLPPRRPLALPTIRISRLKILLRLLLPLVALPGHAAETLSGSVGTITGEDWRIARLEVELDLTAPALRGQVRIGTLELTGAGQSYTDTVIDCGRIELTTGEFTCGDAAFTIDLPGAGRQTFPGEVSYERRTGVVRFAVREVPVANGRVAVHGTASKAAIGVEFRGDELQLAGLAAIGDQLALVPEGLGASGTVDLSGSLRTEAGSVSQATVKAELSDASIANELGTLVTASMHGLIDVNASRTAGGWRFSAGVSADAGEIYIEPVYANVGGDPVTMTAEGAASGDFRGFGLTAFSLQQGSLLDASGNLRVDMPLADDGEVKVSGTVELADASVEAIYSGLLQVLAAGTIFGDLDTAGTVSGTISFEDSALAGADLELNGVTADDVQGRFAIYELNGAVHWPGPEAPEQSSPSSLHWDSASAYNIAFGGGKIEAHLGGNDFVLLQPLRIPTMGGALLINRLSVSNVGDADASGLLDAELEPIKLGALTAAFGWPAFSGSLSGKLPLLQYDGGIMTVGGTLSAQAFDGNIEFANLQLEQPFGLVPRLSGDLHLRQLDLELVTNTFSFGLIQGRLSGDVTGLEMVGWRPVAMDLHLYTPPGDSSRRRISQRAVENLASVGGGGGAAVALSSGFMKFFEVFAYEEIGIRCVLKDGTCAMSGAGTAGRDELGGGYYIVKGSGLPRIDVVGYRSQVSWPRLVTQLESIMESGAPVVN